LFLPLVVAFSRNLICIESSESQFAEIASVDC